MKRIEAALLATTLLLAIAAGGARAQEATAGSDTLLAPVEIRSKKNPGDLPYKGFYDIQNFVLSLQPAEPRVIDFSLRLSFTGIPDDEADSYLPTTWAVAIVGDTVDHTVPVSRGGWFTLPDLQQAAKERATIMFNTQTRKGYLGAGWKLRLAADNTLPYPSFAQAFDQVKSVQKKIPWYRYGLREEKAARFDALKACFGSAGGSIEIDGQAAPTQTRGTCKMLKFDAERAASKNSVIAFVGQLENVTLDRVN
ncbi:MAG: hypothetical protein ACXW2U_18380 [Telluria sp.]